MTDECSFDRYIEAKQIIADIEGKTQVDTGEHWYQRMWRPVAALVFLIVVLFDFVAMPIIMEVTNNRSSYEEVLEAINNIDSDKLSSEFLQKADLQVRSWTPLTTTGGGLFFISFGAILGAAAWTRGTEKTARENKPNMEQNVLPRLDTPSRQDKIEEYLRERARRPKENSEGGPL